MRKQDRLDALLDIYRIALRVFRDAEDETADEWSELLDDIGYLYVAEDKLTR